MRARNHRTREAEAHNKTTVRSVRLKKKKNNGVNAAALRASPPRDMKRGRLGNGLLSRATTMYF